MRQYRPTFSKWCPVKRKRLFAYLQDEIFIVNNKAYTVPAGYWFDGATTQRPLWGVFSPTGIAFFPAGLHDFLCDTKGRGLYGEYNLTKMQVDKIFYDHLLMEDTPKAQAKLMFAGVRTPIGQLYWDNESFPHYLLTETYTQEWQEQLTRFIQALKLKRMPMQTLHP
jgi:hypothetical protein